MPPDNNSQVELERRRFRMDTTINVSHIVTTIGLIVSLFVWGSDVKEMLARHDTSIQTLKEGQSRLDSSVREELRELNRKIDRLIERKG